MVPFHKRTVVNKQIIFYPLGGMSKGSVPNRAPNADQPIWKSSNHMETSLALDNAFVEDTLAISSTSHQGLDPPEKHMTRTISSDSPHPLAMTSHPISGPSPLAPIASGLPSLSSNASSSGGYALPPQPPPPHLSLSNAVSAAFNSVSLEPRRDSATSWGNPGIDANATTTTTVTSIHHPHDQNNNFNSGSTPQVSAPPSRPTSVPPGGQSLHHPQHSIPSGGQSHSVLGGLSDSHQHQQQQQQGGGGGGGGWTGTTGTGPVPPIAPPTGAPSSGNSAKTLPAASRWRTTLVTTAPPMSHVTPVHLARGYGTGRSEAEVSDSSGQAVVIGAGGNGSGSKHYFSKHHRRPPVILSSEDSQYFANAIAQALGAGTVEALQLSRREFGDGETYYRLELDNRQDLVGRDFVYVSTTKTDKELLELYRVGSGASGYGTHKRIFCIPYFGYSTMERAVRPGEVVTAKTNCRLLSSIPNSGLGNSFMMMDLHAAGLLEYFEGDCARMELYGEDALTQGIRALNLGIESNPSSFVFASADLGRPLWVDTFARRFGTGLAFVQKTRSLDTTIVGNVIGDVTEKTVIIYDDMTRSAKTLINAAEAYLARGALAVYAVLSHLSLHGPAVVQAIEESPIVKLVATNSHPMSQHPAVLNSKKFLIVDVSYIFAQAIRRELALDDISEGERV